MQATCDHVAILSHGRCIVSGAVTDVLATGHRAGLRVRLDDLPAGLEVLRSAGIAADPDGDAIRVTLPLEESARITRALAERGLYLSELRPEEVDHQGPDDRGRVRLLVRRRRGKAGGHDGPVQERDVPGQVEREPGRLDLRLRVGGQPRGHVQLVADPRWVIPLDVSPGRHVDRARRLRRPVAAV